MKTIIIIGGGLSGILSAIQLLDRSKDVFVKIINTKHPTALGVAYNTNDPEHLLNVTAGKMSLYPLLPDHFTDWLIANDYPAENISETFQPRMVYGKYISEVFNSYISNKQLEIIDSLAIDIIKQTNQYAVLLSSGRNIIAEKIILALGNFLPSSPKSNSDDFFKSNNYFQDPWNPAYSKNISAERSILLIGTGLTMIDCLLTLKKAGFKGHFFVVSPRGYTPAPHGKIEKYPDFYDEISGQSLLGIFQTVRMHLKKAESKNISWRGVVDSLRPHVQKIWINFSEKEKQQFISHIRHIWGIARHRVPVSIYDEIIKLQEEGRLEIIGGRISDIHEKENVIRVFIRLRKNSTLRELTVGRVINCTGPQTNYRELKDELVVNLLKKKMILSDNLNMGIKTKISGQVLYYDHQESNDIFALGSLLRGVLWETTAVPEIRTQAAFIAKQIIESE